MIKGKKILVLTSSWAPNYTMNGTVAKNLVDVIKQENEVFIMAFLRDDNDEPSFEGKSIWHIKGHPYRLKKAKSGELRSKTTFGRIICRIITNAVRGFSSFSRLISPIGINQEMCTKYARTLKKVLKEFDFDYVLAIGEPYETYYAIDRVHVFHPNIKYVVYQVDRFATSEEKIFNILPNKARNRRRAELIDRISEYARVCIVNYAYDMEVAALHKGNNVISIGQPLVMPRICSGTSEVKFGQSYTNLVYTGSLYKNLRPVHDSLMVLKELLSYPGYKIHFYHRGDCGDEISSEARDNEDIVNHGSVSSDVAYDAVESSDVLFCISTIKGNYISGKTFEFISTGKPIVFFYYNEKDISIKYFQKYELMLFVHLVNGREKENAQLIDRFIKDNVASRVAYEDVESIFSFDTPKGVINSLFPDDIVDG